AGGFTHLRREFGSCARADPSAPLRLEGQRSSGGEQMKRLFGVCLTAGLAAHAAPISGVPAANVKADGYAPASQLTREWRQHPVAVGAMPLENPEGIVGWYGYQNDAPSTENPAVPQMMGKILTNTTPPTPYEAQKTEPDKNTYLVLWGQRG